MDILICVCETNLYYEVQEKASNFISKQFSLFTEASPKSFIYEGGYREWDVTKTANAFNKSFIQFHSYPIAGSNFTKGIVGFWNSTVAAKHGYKKTSASSEYFM